MTGELKAAIESDAEIKETWPRIKLAGYRGSVAHGTAGDIIDDIDIGGVFIAPANHYFGLHQFEHVERIGVAGKYDFALFEIRKYFKLLLKSNPNVLSLLWLPQNLYIIQSDWGHWLIENRQIFMSKALYKSFGGYAYGQLQRMTHSCTDQAYQGARRRERFEKFGYDCYDAETTEFLTDHGWRVFDDVEKECQLATINQEGNLEYQEPIEHIDHFYTGSMYTVEPYSSRAIVTENHNLLVSPAHRSRNNKYSVAYDETKADWQLISVRSILERHRSHYHIRRAPEPRTDEYAVVDTYLALSGLYLSEGSTNYRNNKVKSIRFVQSKPGLFWHAADEMCRVYPIRRYDSDKETQWVLHGDVARSINKDFGHANNKHLPNWCFHLSARQADILWENLMYGDGCSKVSNDCYYTNSARLSGDIQAAMISAGFPCVVYGPYCYNSNLLGQEGKQAKIYHVVRSKLSTAFHCLNFSRLLREGNIVRGKDGYPIKEGFVTDRRVVCFTVPNRTLITRNGGAVAIHGNCKNASHLIRLLRMGIEALTTGEINVARHDAKQLKEIKAGQWTLTQVGTEAGRLQVLLDEAFVRCKLPNKPDYEKAEKVLIDILRTELIERKHQ